MSAREFNKSQPLGPGRSTYGVAAPPGDGEAIRHAREWLAHVEAGRIGKRIPTDPEIIARRERNERIVLGK